MNEKKALMTFVLLSLAVLPGLTLATPVAEESPKRIVGIKVGDWAKYGNFFATWTSNDPSAQEPPLDLIEHNNTKSVINTIKNISGTKITFQMVTHYNNDTETTSISCVDINTGVGNGTFMFISANLNQGERVYDSTEHAHTWINETFQLVYVDALRETNYLKASASQFWPDTDGSYLVYQIEYFWDKTTGVLTERAGAFVSTTGEYTTVSTRSEVMIDTNIWEEDIDTTPPTAEAGPDQTAIVDQIVSFHAGSSSDNEGGWGIASYEWDFGDGTQGTGIAITHAFKAPGNYTVTLTVEDWAGNGDEDTLTVMVQEDSAPPSIMGVVILVTLLIAGLFVWGIMAKK